MYEVVKDGIYWMIKHSNGEFLFQIVCTGEVGLEKDLSDHDPITNHYRRVRPVMFGEWDKYKAVKLCEKLNLQLSREQG